MEVALFIVLCWFLFNVNTIRNTVSSLGSDEDTNCIRILADGFWSIFYMLQFAILIVIAPGSIVSQYIQSKYNARHK